MGEEPDQLARLIRSCTVHFVIYLVISDQIANSADPDQTAQVCRLSRLIWLYQKGIYMEERVDLHKRTIFDSHICEVLPEL
jgi:hypothetical protein